MSPVHPRWADGTPWLVGQTVTFRHDGYPRNGTLVAIAADTVTVADNATGDRIDEVPTAAVDGPTEPATPGPRRRLEDVVTTDDEETTP